VKDLNRWQGIGRVGKDPESKAFASGDAVCNFTVACSDSFWGKESTLIERTEWVNIVAYKGLADVASKYLKKGSRVYVDGKLATRKWQDKEGKSRYTTEIKAENIIMLDPKPKEEGASAEEHREKRMTSVPEAFLQKPAQPKRDDFEDDDLPF
jgi:single-strand DNA-binding protein